MESVCPNILDEEYKFNNIWFVFRIYNAMLSREINLKEHVTIREILSNKIYLFVKTAVQSGESIVRFKIVN